MIPQSFPVQDSVPAERVVVMHSAGGKVLLGVGGGTLSAIPIGISIDKQNVTGQAVAVKGAGERARLLFNDTITSGTAFTCDASGKGIPMPGTLPTGTCFAVGVALETAADTGAVIDVYIQPMCFNSNI